MPYLTNPLPRLRQNLHHNVSTFRSQPLSEISGSLGDLGTLLPLMTALTLSNSISLPSTLLFTGLANILTGISFGVPLPVQPMKAIAAVAISRNFSMEENAAAGIVVAGCIGILSVTGLIKWADHVTPVPVVKGIQVGAGLSLCISAGTKMLLPLTLTGPWWGDNLLIALGAAILLLATLISPRLPYALLIFILGITLSFFSPSPSTHHPSKPPTTHPFPIPILHPSPSTFYTSTLTASLGQLPLTLLNSLLAASSLCATLLPSPPYPTAPTPTSLGLSVSLINLLACPFGAMPVCHGSGGLAAQVRFGARSGSSVVVLGCVKMGVGIVACWYGGGEEGVVRVLRGVPGSLLGVLVFAAGLELCRVGEGLNTDAGDLRVEGGDGEGEGGVGDEHGTTELSICDAKSTLHLDDRARRERWSVMLITVAALLAFQNDAVGFAAGLAWHWGLKGARRLEERRARGSAWWWSESWFRTGTRRADSGERQRLLPSHEDGDTIA